MNILKKLKRIASNDFFIFLLFFFILLISMTYFAINGLINGAESFAIGLFLGILFVSFTSFYFFIKMLKNKRITQEEISIIKQKDFLTGALNRKEYISQLSNYLSNDYLIMFLSITNLNKIQEALGNDISEELVYQFYKELLKESEILIGRLNEGDFSIVLNKQNIHGIEKLHEKLEKEYYIESIQNSIFITVNIGIVEKLEGLKIEEVLNNGQITLKHNKEKLKSKYSIYQPTMSSAIAPEDLLLENEIRQALEKRQIKIFYQPKVKTNNKKIYSAESLIRWVRIDKPQINTEYFVNILEETGLIIEVGYFIFEEAIKDLKEWLKINEKMTISINLSPKQFLDPNFISTIEKIRKKYEVNSKLIELEVTESSFIEHTEEVLDFFYDIKQKGYKISLDDFGTGYSSLSYLTKMPIDVIKIDKSFIQDIEYNEYNKEVVKSIINLSHALKLEVVTEGVETYSEFQLLKELGSDSIQGYFFSRPLSKEDFIKYLENEKKA